MAVYMASGCSTMIGKMSEFNEKPNEQKEEKI
jgi:hypothetical protein